MLFLRPLNKESVVNYLNWLKYICSCTLIVIAFAATSSVSMAGAPKEVVFFSDTIFPSDGDPNTWEDPITTFVEMDGDGNELAEGIFEDAGTWRGWAISVDRVMITASGDEVFMRLQFSAKRFNNGNDPDACIRHYSGHWNINGGTGSYQNIVGHGTSDVVVNFDCVTFEELGIHEVNRGLVQNQP